MKISLTLGLPAPWERHFIPGGRKLRFLGLLAGAYPRSITRFVRRRSEKANRKRSFLEQEKQLIRKENETYTRVMMTEAANRIFNAWIV